jgi:P4 family phage/plasmid primase-like protien
MSKDGTGTKQSDVMVDPTRLAESFLCDYSWTENADDPKPETTFHTLRRWREEFYIWKDGRYIRLADDTVKQNLTTWLQSYAKGIRYQDNIHIPIRTSLLNNVMLNLQPMIHIRETQQLNTFLDGVDRGRFLCFENDLLNLETRELIAHTPNYFTPVQLPYPYDAHAECPDFDVFLGDIMLGRQDYIDLLQEFIGYLFRPDLREQKFLLCVGEGANGKGVLFELVQALVGVENCSQVPISHFADRFSLYSTIGKVCNLTHESSHVLEDEAENILKSYVAGDSLSIDRKYREPIDNLRPTAKLLIATNSLPRFGDKTEAIWRRMLLCPFDLSLEDRYQIKDKAEQLKKELPGVLNWALAGLDRLNAKKGFTIPQGQKKLMEEYRRDADPARAFLMDNYEGSLNEAYVPCAEVYTAYKTFCETNGCHAMNERTFGQHVRRIFPQVERQRIGPRGNRGYVYKGLVSYVS